MLSPSDSPTRAKNEIDHGRFLAENDPEDIWGWKTPAGQRRAERRAELIIQGAKLRPGVHALEIGCGTGNFTVKFAETGASIVAVDISPDLIARAIERSLFSPRVQFKVQPFEEFDTQMTYDSIIGSSVLHHLSLMPSLSAMYRLLRPSGIICFAEPNMLNPQIFAERHFRFLFSSVSKDETAFCRMTLPKKLKAVGFTKIVIRPFDWLHPMTPPSWINKIERIGSLLERIPCIREFAGSVLICAQRP